MTDLLRCGAEEVHCRVGSLEKEGLWHWVHQDVHCRVGSLEKERINPKLIKRVHCRVGSLETGLMKMFERVGITFDEYVLRG